MSIFNLAVQNSELDNKIVAGLERLSQVFRILLWSKAIDSGLSPIQIQILIFIRHHSVDKATVSYLAQEFNITKPTVSDAIKALEQKRLVRKVADSSDARSYRLHLTPSGKKIVTELESYTHPLVELISKATLSDKQVLWTNIVNLIVELNKMQIIEVQRTCYNCHHYSNIDKSHFCGLLNQKLLPQDIRIDCAEFKSQADGL